MNINILAIGDICGTASLAYLDRILRSVKAEHGIHFAVANGENADGLGLLPKQADQLFQAGVDVITLGNHTYNKRQIIPVLDENRYILRPANFGPGHPGRGFGVFEGPTGLRIGVMNLIGRCELHFHADNPLTKAAEIMRENEADFWLIDFHAEATSEKGAFACYLDGLTPRPALAAIWGTHTHVPTADVRILPNGTGFVTDLGMVGGVNSVIGIQPADSVNAFLCGVPKFYTQADGPHTAGMVRFTVDSKTGVCVGAQRIDQFE